MGLRHRIVTCMCPMVQLMRCLTLRSAHRHLSTDIVGNLVFTHRNPNRAAGVCWTTVHHRHDTCKYSHDTCMHNHSMDVCRYVRRYLREVRRTSVCEVQV
jgi:hypothetical protein